MKTRKQLKNLSLIAILSTIVSCSSNHEERQPGMAVPVKEYQVIAVDTQATTLFKEYPTTIEGQQTVEILPKIAGYIEQILVDEGAFVKKGQILFRLNANDIEASVRSAEAQVEVAEAQVITAKINVEKTTPLVERNIISSFELESVKSALKVSEAQLSQAKANLANAKANLQYTVITSPTDGIIGNFPYRVGSLVSSTIAQPLTTVSNTSSMYAYFSLNEKEFLKLIKGLEGNDTQDKLSKLANVALIMADNSVYPICGKVETASGLIDPQTGSVNIRASFPNPEGLLRSGNSGLVRIPTHLDSEILIPQKATYELQGKHFVFVVGADNIVKNTNIEILAGNLKDFYIVTDGLKAGDQVVIEGINSLRNDTPIKPVLTQLKQLTENQLPSNN